MFWWGELHLMSNPPVVILSPQPIVHSHSEFKELLSWQYEGDDAFVTRLLENDIPQRILFEGCTLWVYRDRMNHPDGKIVGFGALAINRDHSRYTHGNPHLHIPLLGKNPSVKSLGYGKSILNHLISEAALRVKWQNLKSDAVFLEVYTTSIKAISLYQDDFGFVKLTASPCDDKAEGKQFWVMARSVGVVRGR